MTPAEIIRAHAQKQNLDPKALALQVQKFLEQPQSQVVTQGDCLFLVRNIDGVAFFYILNGGNAAGYLRALKSGADMLRHMGFEKASMRVSDMEKSKQIAASIGVQNVSYKRVNSKTDPYLMTMEL
jgi:hypothetical protein